MVFLCFSVSVGAIFIMSLADLPADVKALYDYAALSGMGLTYYLRLSGCNADDYLRRRIRFPGGRHHRGDFDARRWVVVGRVAG